MNMEKGFTLWFTGLSGAGKSTLSEIVVQRLRDAGRKVELLDGDVVRTNLSQGLTFSKEDRDINLRRIGFVCELLSRNGVIAIVAAISPYREVREELRARIPLDVHGGREAGYRTVSRIEIGAAESGRFRCSVETANGQLLGSKSIKLQGTMKLDLVLQVFNFLNTKNLQDQYAGGRVNNALSASFSRNLCTAPPAASNGVAIRPLVCPCWSQRGA